MRKTLAAAAAAVIAGFSSLALAGTPLSVAATPVPHADILKLIEPDLKAAGYDLKVLRSPPASSRSFRSSPSTSCPWQPIPRR